MLQISSSSPHNPTPPNPPNYRSSIHSSDPFPFCFLWMFKFPGWILNLFVIWYFDRIMRRRGCFVEDWHQRWKLLQTTHFWLRFPEGFSDYDALSFAIIYVLAQGIHKCGPIELKWVVWNWQKNEEILSNVTQVKQCPCLESESLSPANVPINPPR